jgi:hypothetical protein
MRRAVTCIVLLALLYSQCSPLYYSGYSRIDVPITVSDVVGEVIDAEERNLYCLFGGIEDFEQARFYPIEQGGLCAEIQTKSYTLVAVNREPQMRFILKDYIENYESIQLLKRAFETKWNIIDYDALGFPITENEFAAVQSNSCCIVGATGFGIVSFALSALVAWGYSDDHLYDDQDDVNTVCLLIVIGGTAGGLVTGGLLGRIIDKNRAMDAIKESRMPRPVR